jgi:magnesium-transporting ATPase (P-type)
MKDGRIRNALEVAALASRPQATAADGQGHAGDPVDLAVPRAAERAGIDRAATIRDRPGVGLVPFSSDRKVMAAFHRSDSAIVAYVKGAQRQVLALSDRTLDQDGEHRSMQMHALDFCRSTKTLRAPVFGCSHSRLGQSRRPTRPACTT